MISLSDTFWFGKYKGERIFDILSKDIAYVIHCLDVVEGFELSNEHLFILELYVEEETNPWCWE